MKIIIMTIISIMINDSLKEIGALALRVVRCNART